MSLPTPYYEHDGIVIYHGDCRDILPHLPKVDLVLTDPPYGIDFVSRPTMQQRAKGCIPATWDTAKLPLDVLLSLIARADYVIIWGGNYYSLPPVRGFFIWDKGPSFKNRSFAECEFAWNNLPGNAQIILHQHLADARYAEHPTQKPLALMKWCIMQPEKFDEPSHTILDPFMGSGTTLRAAKDLGRKCIGIEIEEKYCEIAVRRLAQTVLPL